MEVKDVRSTNLVNDSKANQAAVSRSSQSSETTKTDDAVETQVRSTSKNQVRVKLNDVINASNVAKEATTQITKIVQSISGIIKQASQEDLPEKRKATLEAEANELVDEIRRTADTQASNGVKPLAGDKIRLEVEEKIGRTLDVILPDDAKNAFGLTEIDFSTRESIISTIANVKQAEASILRLRNAVDEASKNIESTAGTLDVALQNSEAADNTIRDLDEALKVAGKARGIITENPDKALKSFGGLGTKALGLLE